MNPDDLASQLAPLRTPAAIGWWPPAPGWWVLALLVLAGIVYALWRWHRRRRRNRYRRLALAELAALQRRGAHTPAALNQLLKATALQVYPAASLAASHGERWVRFLADRCPRVDAGELAALADHYRPDRDRPMDALASAAASWIRYHEVTDV